MSVEHIADYDAPAPCAEHGIPGCLRSHAEKDVTEFVAYVERKWGGGTGHTANNRWVSHAELRKHAEAFIEEQAIYRQADEQCKRPRESSVIPPGSGVTP